MSSTASNYNLQRLEAGIVLAALATIAGLMTSSKDLLEAKSTGLWTSSIAAVYGIMMFASSYVEEEHHFWYWISSGWLSWLSLKHLVPSRLKQGAWLMTNRSNSLGTVDSVKAWKVLPLLLALRIVRVWNQTGQKHAGEPDIAKTILPAHNILLWLLVLATYLDIIQRLARRAMPWASHHLSSAASLALGVAAVGFKIAFTKADAPELLSGLDFLILRPMEETSLVAQARAVFSSLAIMTVLTILPVVYQTFYQGSKAPGNALFSTRMIQEADRRYPRSFTTFTRLIHSLPRNSIANHQYPTFPSLRRPAPCPAVSSTLSCGVDVDISAYSARLIFRIWGLERHLVH